MRTSAGSTTLASLAMRVRLSCYGAQWFSVLRLVLNEATLYLTEKQVGLIAKLRRPTL
jgi:hypothetical protein